MNNSSFPFLKIFLLVLFIINFFSSSIIAPPGPPSTPTELLISTNLTFIPADNITICNITVIPIDSFGNEVDALINVISSLNGSYLLDMNGNWILQPKRVICQTVNHKINISFKSRSEGIANITIMAGSCINYTEIEVISPIIFSINYTLKQGWNLISFPTINFEFAEDFLQSCDAIDVIAKWDAENQTYIVHPREGPNNFKIENGEGYFVYAIDNVSYKVEGYLFPNTTIYLSKGWNIIGWKGGNITAEEMFDLLPDCDCIVKWDNVNQQWIIHPREGPNNFVIERGEGIFIHLNKESILNL